LHGAGERTQDQQRRRRLLLDRPQYEQSQRNPGRRRGYGAQEFDQALADLMDGMADRGMGFTGMTA